MKSFDYVITDEVGIHARPAGLLAKAVKALGAKVTIAKGDKSADATRLMALMSMGIKKGDTVTVSVEVGTSTDTTSFLPQADTERAVRVISDNVISFLVCILWIPPC